VSESPEPVPQRIGDAERDQAATYLREALAQGRLEQEEFDERVDRALRAKTQADLDPLFKDLPGPRPGQAMNPAAGFQAPPWQRPEQPAGRDVAVPAGKDVAGRDSTGKVLTVLAAIAWPLTIMVLFATSWDYWWLMFLPIMLSSVAGKFQHDNRQENRHGNPHGQPDS
jgi:hypothetical protein